MNIRVVAAAAIAALSLAGGVAAAQAQDIGAHRFRFALQPAKGSAQVLGAEKFASLVSEKSGGKIVVKVFEGGQLGTDASTLSALQTGTIDFSLMSVGTLAGHDKAYLLFDIPFLFETYQEADAVADGPVGKKLIDRLPAKGMRIISFAELGFRHIHNSKGPINKLDDLKNLKLRVIPLPMYLEFINALGATAVPMPFTELYTALDQKAVDGATNPFDNIASAKFYEVNKYLSLSRHMYSMMAFLMSEKTWNKLNPKEQAVIMSAAEEAKIFERKTAREQSSKDFELLKTKMQVNEIPQADIAKMHELAKPVVEKFSKDIGPDLISELNQQLTAMRVQKK